MELAIIGRYGVYPPVGGACSSYVLRGIKGGDVLLDCGPGTLAKLGREGIGRVQAVVLTHLHWDHCSDALAMCYALASMGRTIELIAPDRPEAICALFAGMDAFVPIWLSADRPVLQLGDAQCSFYPMRHPAPCYGIRVEQGGAVFAYTGDTNTADALPSLLHGAHLAVMDGCLTDEQWSESLPHLSARKAADYAQEAGVRRLLIGHLPPTGGHDVLLEQARAAFPAAELAQEDGLYAVDVT